MFLAIPPIFPVFIFDQSNFLGHIASCPVTALPHGPCVYTRRGRWWEVGALTSQNGHIDPLSFIGKLRLNIGYVDPLTCLLCATVSSLYVFSLNRTIVPFSRLVSHSTPLLSGSTLARDPRPPTLRPTRDPLIAPRDVFPLCAEPNGRHGAGAHLDQTLKYCQSRKCQRCSFFMIIKQGLIREQGAKIRRVWPGYKELAWSSGRDVAATTMEVRKALLWLLYIALLYRKLMYHVYRPYITHRKNYNNSYGTSVWWPNKGVQKNE